MYQVGAAPAKDKMLSITEKVPSHNVNCDNAKS